MKIEILNKLIFICGILHLSLAIGSSIIPEVLNWNTELAKVKPLIRQMFWTYAAYILVINVCFGLVSIWGTKELLDHSFLAACITLFISIYWVTRIGIQFFYFDTTDAPKGLLFTLGEITLVALFILFTAVYFLAFLYNNSWI
jgi:membrane protein YdbS with pleckstrin-like domain